MNRAVLPALSSVLILISSCEKGAKLDGSTEESLKVSIESAKKELTAEEREKFEKAAMLLTFHDKNIFQLGSDPEAAKRVMRDRLNGKTASEIIAEADKIRSSRSNNEIAQVAGEIKELEQRKSQAEEARTSLADFSVERSRFSFNKDSYSTTPVIDITVKNGLNSAVSKVHFHAILATPGRAVPWVTDDFSYEISGGIEPDESATWSLAPNRFGEWGKAPKDRNDMVLTLTVIRVDGADGKALFDASFSTQEEERLKELKALPSE